MNMRERSLEMIAREAAHCEAGRTGRIIAKLDPLDSSN
jgi:polyphosphate kinase